MLRVSGLTAAMTLGFLACGCSGGGSLKPVRGKLTVAGKPLGGAGVVFAPIDGKGLTAFAETAPDGSFRMMTNLPGRNEPTEGAMPGEYAVLIVWDDPPHPYLTTRAGTPAKAALEKDYLEWKATHKHVVSPVGEEYATPSTSPLKVTVPVANGEVNFDLPAKAN